MVDNEGEKFLATCESCDKDVYLPEGQSTIPARNQ
jgi:hypothetical protein